MRPSLKDLATYVPSVQWYTVRRVWPTGSGNPQIINFRPGPLALAVWNNITKTVLLAKEVELGAWPHPSVDSKEDHLSKNCLEPGNFSWCSLWSSVPTARCKPRILKLEDFTSVSITQESRSGDA